MSKRQVRKNAKRKQKETKGLQNKQTKIEFGVLASYSWARYLLGVSLIYPLPKRKLILSLAEGIILRQIVPWLEIGPHVHCTSLSWC